VQTNFITLAPPRARCASSELGRRPHSACAQPATPDDHSKVVPLLPIPNRTVKRLRADDSAHPCGKVGHRQALIPKTPVSSPHWGFAFETNGKCHPAADRRSGSGKKSNHLFIIPWD